MSKHPDADAFMRKYLTQPTDVTARLVFADWLEETGVSHNVAWAYYIRLKAEAGRHDFGSAEQQELDREADEYAPQIRANLTIPAKLFVGYPKSLLQLLPAANITVKLDGFEVPLPVVEVVPQSVAEENLVLPLDMQGRTFLFAALNPHDTDLMEKLEFILNHHVMVVGAERADLEGALIRAYASIEAESVTEYLYTEPAPVIDLSTDEESPVSRIVNLIIIPEALRLSADRILITPEPDGCAVRYRIDDEWIERDRLPTRLLYPVTRRLAVMTLIPVEGAFLTSVSPDPMTGAFPLHHDSLLFRVRVTIQPSPDGPTTQIDFVREPVG